MGLLGGYALSHGVFHQSTGYLAEAFTLGTRTTVTARPLILALVAGVLATCLASAVPLLDLRRTGALDAVYHADGVPGNMLSDHARRGLALTAAILLALTTALFATTPSLALSACALLALATVLAVPLTFAGVLRAARALAERRQRLTILPVALTSLRTTTLRSLALAATGAIALFGSVALGGARGDLLRGIEGFAHGYSADASIWVGNPGDNQATVDFRPDGAARRIAGIPGVASVRAFQGGFLAARRQARVDHRAAARRRTGKCSPVRSRAEARPRRSPGSAKAAGSPSPSRLPKNITSVSGTRSPCRPRAARRR